VIAKHESAGLKEDARGKYLRGLLEDMRGGKPEATAKLLSQAHSILAGERASFFDPRRRGTVIESSGEILRDLALRLVALGRDADAFTAFESARARGLGELTNVLGREDVTAADRAWLSELLRREAETSSIGRQIAEQVIGEGLLDAPAEQLSRWDQSDRERRSYMRSNAEVRDRLAWTSFSPASLAELQRAARDAGTPVLLYWADPTNVYVWYVGPHGSDFRSVFLPETALTEKTMKLFAAIQSHEKNFDERSAKELYFYLIAPFEDLLDADRVIIVPQGPIVGLPFEALIEPDTGRFAVDRWIVSYAPNATMALDMLKRPVPVIKRTTALVDVEIDDQTHEKRGIESVPGWS
jgi:hypothetical protein